MRMRFDVLTLFPDMFQGTLGASILKRAQEAGQLEVHLHDIRAMATDRHKTVDDTPYGGGAGMVLKVDILAAALKTVSTELDNAGIDPQVRRTVLLCAQGKRFTQPIARYISSTYQQVTLICGHYEGFDERVRSLVDAELSIGDFVLTGGELPAMMVIDAVTRLLPEVIAAESPHEESFSLLDPDGSALLEYPQYTRPLEFNGEKVPDILLSGNHAEIARWRQEQAVARTKRRREDTDETI